MIASSIHGKWYWFVRGLLSGLTLAWVVEVMTRDGLGPIHRYVAPFVITSLILMTFYDLWRIAKTDTAKKSKTPSS